MNFTIFVYYILNKLLYSNTMAKIFLPPVPLPIQSSSSLVDMTADMTPSLREKLFFLLRIKHQEQDDEKLYTILDSLILEIIVQNSQEILKYLIEYPQMLKISFCSVICKYFINDLNQIDKNLRTSQYMSVYNTTCQQFTNYLLNEIRKRHILNTNSSSASTYASASAISSEYSTSSTSAISSEYSTSSASAYTTSLVDARVLDDVSMYDSKNESDNNTPLSKRRKTVRFEDVECFNLYLLAEVSCEITKSNVK